MFAEIIIWRHPKEWKEPQPFRADIWLRPSGGDHHAIGATPIEALCAALNHWRYTETAKK